jgi:hypothetical protein
MEGVECTAAGTFRGLQQRRLDQADQAQLSPGWLGRISLSLQRAL